MKSNRRGCTVANIFLSTYRTALVRRSHQLLKLGYERLTPSEYQSAPEEEITGELIRTIDEVCDNPPPSISPWIDFFHAAEETRVAIRGRRGKARLRIDIVIQSSEVRPRARFPFEAKRLGPKHSVSAYCGADGMGAFLSGEYAAQCDDVGMIGYVQSDDAQQWAKRIEDRIVTHNAEHFLRPDGGWTKCDASFELNHVFRTGHDRPTLNRDVEIYHSLLCFP